MSVGCLCDCGHRTPEHHFHASGATPCAKCDCVGFVHADNDPLCAYKDLPLNKSGRIDMDVPLHKLIQLFEPLIGLKEKP